MTSLVNYWAGISDGAKGLLSLGSLIVIIAMGSSAATVQFGGLWGTPEVARDNAQDIAANKAWAEAFEAQMVLSLAQLAKRQAQAEEELCSDASTEILATITSRTRYCIGIERAREEGIGFVVGADGRRIPIEETP